LYCVALHNTIKLVQPYVAAASEVELGCYRLEDSTNGGLALTWKDLISEAELTLGFINGQGLGSFLLAFVLVAFIFGPTRDGSTVRRVVQKVLESFERKSKERN